MKTRKNFAAILVLMSAAAALWAAEAGAEQAAAKPSNLEGLPNFAKVSVTLFRGAQPAAEGFARLKEMGVKTVINLRSLHSDRNNLEGTGLQYFRISAKAWHPEEEDVLKFLKVALNPDCQPVFVHCKCGSDRTGMMIAIYRMAEQGWSIEKVFKEMDDFGRHPIFTEIADYLKKLDIKSLKEKLEQTPMQKVEVIK